MSGAFILAVSNRKGGSGKTTTAVNLAAELAARGVETLLIDLDTQGHAALGVGVTAPAGGNVHAIFRDPQSRLRPAIAPTAHARLAVLPADPMYDGGAAQDMLVLARRLDEEGIVRDFQVIIIDTPPTLDVVLLNALAAAQGILVPLPPHPLGLHGVQQLSRLFFRVGSTVNPDLRLLGLLPVMLDRRIRLHATILDEATARFGANRILRGIRNDIRLAEAFAAGQPIRKFAPRCRGALDYHLLADELSANWRLSIPIGADVP